MKGGEAIVRFGEVDLGEAEGAILAHAVRSDGLAFKKGRRLSAADISGLRRQGVTHVTAARLESGDIDEDCAARQLAAAVAGSGLRIAEPFTGRVNLHAEAAGIVVVDRIAIDRLNARDEAVTLATLPEFAVVTRGQMVATIKIIPFGVASALLAECLGMIASPLVRLAPFVALRARLIQTVLPGTSPKMLDKTIAVTERRLAEVGATLLGETRAPHDVASLAAELGRSGGADLLLIAGASAITDRRDVLPAGIEAAGGEVLHFGMPVDPGNLILLARLRGHPVLGLPGCARSPKLNGFDWVLQRMAAGLEVAPVDIMRMGVGGLLMEIPTRPQPREGLPREQEPAKATGPRIAGIVLAAGQSRRMGGPNKLLIDIDGRPMIRRAVEAALAARLSPVVVVTGHMHERVAAALTGMPIEVAHNPAFEQGLSTSLRIGIDALAAEVDAAVICLGDMPRITGRMIGRLAAAYNPIEGRAIVVPTRHGKRGNPVLWDRSLFAEMRELAGDAGAKGLIGRHEELVAEIEMADDATLTDIDTPEALAALTGSPA